MNRYLIITVMIVLCTGCSIKPAVIAPQGEAPLAYSPLDNTSLLSDYAPIVNVENSFASFNKVGSAKANYSGERENVFVDSNQASFYALQKNFTGERGDQYTNLIYRMHFEQVPYSLIPFHLTAGNYGGLIIVITLNSYQEPVLITTVHSCGCYLGFTPTSYLADDAYPQNWNREINEVYGEFLPTVLIFPSSFDTSNRLLIKLRNATHRVKDIETITLSQARDTFTLVNSDLISLDTLNNLPLPDGSTTSFFHTDGLQKGYVKGAIKPFELLLMSWWTFDLFVGRDKEYGPHKETGTVFYTSLKPWNRKDSDMWPFEDFLAFWGWRL